MTTSLEKKIYSRDEAMQKAIEYFKGDILAGEQFIRKYALKISDNEILEYTPEQAHPRLANEIARIESKYKNPLNKEKIYDLIKDFKYIIPQGGPMAGIGNDFQIVSLSNCFVIGSQGPSDSYGAIMRVDQEQVQLMKRRGGVGHDLSHIRPKGSSVKNSALTSTGVVPFMERYSNSTREVAQDGRRGALMLSISIKHPDAEDFIDAKLEQGKITGANISVKIDDEFMNAVKNGTNYIQQFPINSENPIIKKEINPKKLWDKIIYNAWKSAEPGVLFWDTIKRESIPDSYKDSGFETVSTNPCGEIPLCPYDSCRLIAVNLYSYVDKPFTKDAKFNHDLFKEHAYYTQRIMDDIIDLELEKIDGILAKIKSDPEDEETKLTEKRLWEKIRAKTIEGRRSGIGITGEGDMIAAMGLKYGTDEATKFATNVHKNFALEVYRSSVELAKERGAFPLYDAEKEKNNPFIKRIKEADPNLYQEMIKHGRRNIALLTIAPTGTVSIMAQTTSGIEPTFLIAYERNVKIESGDKETKITYIDNEGIPWHTYNVFHPKFEEWLKANGLNVEEVKEYKKEKLDEIIKKSPYDGATSNDVDWVKKVEMQGAIQKWVDHSISATTNMPKDTPKEIVAEAYMKAWESGCKGHTIYRDGSRGKAVLNSGNLEERITLVQQNVKQHAVLDIKSQAIKYKIKRQQSQDSLHITLTSDLYVDDANKKAYFIPNEVFQTRAPLGAATSVSFAQSGMDRTEILRGPDPDYAEFVIRLESAFSNEEEGIGPRKIKSIEHAAGLAFEDYFTRNGIIGKDPNTNRIVNLVHKKDLRKVEGGTEEYKSLMSQVRITDDGKEINISGNNGKLDKKFICNNCGSEKSTFRDGCHSPSCAECGNDNGVGCS